MVEARAGAARRVESRRAVLAAVKPQLPFVLRTVFGLAVLAIGANVVGAVVVTLLVFALNATATHHQVVVLLKVATVAVAASVVVGCAVGAIVQRRTLRWVLRGRTPDERDAQRAVRLPLDMSVIAVVIWALDALVISALARLIDTETSTIVGIGSGIVLAGLCSAGITYLVVARVAQPVTRVALTAYPPGRSPFLSVRSRLLLVWLLTTGVPVLGIVMILTAPPGRTHVRGAGVVTACVALSAGVVATALAARAIGKPLRDAVGVLHRVGGGDLDTAVLVEDPGEIGQLQSGINDMVAGLRERDRVQDLFGRHVGPAVAREALRSGVTLSGEMRQVVALFVDITGSTALTRTKDPAEFVAMLNRFFAIVVEEVEGNGGLLNKFEGDAALCVFGAPVTLIDAETAALRAARAIRDRVVADAEVAVGVGVAAGPAVAGQIGSPSRLEYTVIGDAVNEAARLTDIAKGRPGCVVASDSVIERCSPVEREHWTPAAEVVLRGRDVATRTWTA
ncbi:MAG: adenylate/guanylate cyclase domain-containing protein [Jatrophihabitantaceae bacterium]